MNLTTEIERKSLLPGDDPDTTVAKLQEFVSAGADHFILAMNTHEIPALRNMMASVVENILPRLRSPRTADAAGQRPRPNSTEERRVGTGCVSTCRFRWSPDP